MRALVFIALLVSLPARGGDANTPPTADAFAEVTTCAVYFRMVAGAMRQSQSLAALFALEEAKMHQLIRQARRQAAADFGAGNAEQQFQSSWKAALSTLTTEMNANYDNVGTLKYLYDERCEKLIADGS